MSIFDYPDRNHTSEDLAARAHRAEQILGDPLFAEVVEEAERAFVNEWRSASTITDREAAHAKVFALKEVVNQLATIVADAPLSSKRR